MMPCRGLHCNGCRGGGGGAVLAVIIAAVLIIAAIGKAVGKAVTEAGHVLAVVLEVAAITMAAAAGLGLACLLLWAGIRVQRWRAARQVRPAVQLVRAEVVTSEPAAIESPKPRFSPAAVRQPEPQAAEPLNPLT